MADHSKIGRSSRRKGNAFQNQVAKLLTEAWGVPITWTPMSGGSAVRGDLMVGGSPPKYALLYNIECKHRKDVTLRRFLNNPKLVEVSRSQVVIFRDSGETWLTFLITGQPLNPISLGMDEQHPTFIRTKHSKDLPLGFVRIDNSMDYLKRIKDEMLRPIRTKLLIPDVEMQEPI